MTHSPLHSSILEIIERHDVLFLDAFGVLTDHGGLLPGSKDLIETLVCRRQGFYVVTNDASRLESTTSRRFSHYGVEIPPDNIVTSGALVAAYFHEHGLAGATTIVLGTDDTREYVRRGGGVVTDITPDAPVDAVVIGDDDGYPFFPMVDATLTAVFRRLSRGHKVRLILPNPDIIYPKSSDEFGFTAGGVALLLDAGLTRLMGTDAPEIVKLGKPFAPMFSHVMACSGATNPVMIGDQLETDIAGALAAGIATALVETGISRWSEGSEITPTYVLRSLLA